MSVLTCKTFHLNFDRTYLTGNFFGLPEAIVFHDQINYPYPIANYLELMRVGCASINILFDWSRYGALQLLRKTVPTSTWTTRWLICTKLKSWMKPPSLLFTCQRN